jgi:hypothetical protein
LVKKPLPMPGVPGGYTGQVTTRAQNIRYNEHGDPLLFVIEGNVYNGYGMLMADAAQDRFDTGRHVRFLG